VDLENFHLVPRDCRATVFWEMEQVDPEVNARFQKEEWLSATLLEWGRCGKLLVGDDGPEAAETEGLGFAEYAPPTLFDRLHRYPAGEDASDDAVYLAYVYVEDGWRGQGLGSALLRAVARDAVDRGYAAVEAIGDRRAENKDWVLPVTFLAANGFRVVRDDDRHPLLRLDLRGREDRLVNLTEQQLPAYESDASA